MRITKKALRRIKELKRRPEVPPGSGLRLGFNDRGVFLKWDSGAGSEDLVLTRQGLPIYIDAVTYLHLADYELDYDRRRTGFMLRPSARPSGHD